MEFEHSRRHSEDGYSLICVNANEKDPCHWENEHSRRHLEDGQPLRCDMEKEEDPRFLDNEQL